MHCTTFVYITKEKTNTTSILAFANQLKSSPSSCFPILFAYWLDLCQYVSCASESTWLELILVAVLLMSVIRVCPRIQLSTLVNVDWCCWTTLKLLWCSSVNRIECCCNLLPMSEIGYCFLRRWLEERRWNVGWQVLRTLTWLVCY